MSLGPVQLLVVGFDQPDFSGELLGELKRMRQPNTVRVIDLLVVRKDADGVVQRVPHADLSPDDPDLGGAVVSALIGLETTGHEGAHSGVPLGQTRRHGDSHVAAEGEFWSLDEAIPNNSAAVIALIEHRWAIGTREAIRSARGVPIADAWIHPADLVAAGLIEAEDPALAEG